MKNIFKSKKTLILLGIVFIAIFAAIIVNNYQTKTSFKYKNQKNQKITYNKQDKVQKAVNESANQKITASAKKVLQVSRSELYLGDKNAPVTIIEYASLSCPHCASFYRKAFEKLDEEYIQTKKVKFVYRDFPLNQPALAGAVVAVCRSEIAQENRAEAYYDFIKALFKNQDSWAFDPQFINKLESIALLDGMSQEKFSACIKDEKMQEKILKARMVAAKSLNLTSTPTFFINDEVVEGFVDYKTIKKAIEKQLK